MANLDILRDAGMNLDAMSAEEIDALSRLDDAELDTLASIRGKLNGESEVEGHGMHVIGSTTPVVGVAPGIAGLNQHPNYKIDPGKFADGNFVW